MKEKFDFGILKLEIQTRSGQDLLFIKYNQNQVPDPFFSKTGSVSDQSTRKPAKFDTIYHKTDGYPVFKGIVTLRIILATE